MKKSDEGTPDYDLCVSLSPVTLALAPTCVGSGERSV
jgi:hypothetical protein